MKRAFVLFTSGQQVAFDCESITVARNGFDDFTRIEWVGATDGPLFLRLENIDAVWTTSLEEQES